jgi:RHS repeat-associated protein
LTISHGERRSYVYDDENRLVALYVSTHPFVLQNATEFLYDALGRLRIRREYSYVGAPEGPSLPDSPGSDWQLDSETRYLYDGRRVIQERDGSNAPTVSYTRGNDLSGSLEGAGGIGGLLGRSHGYSGGNWSTHNFYHADGGGNITYLVNSSQGLAAGYRYDPYGNLISSSGSLATANVYRFSSKEQHAVSGLHYYGERFYEPNLQRWLNRDPMGEWGGINLYGFVGNRPINEVDPYGLFVLDEDGFPILGTGTAMDSYIWDPEMAAEIRAAEQQVLDEILGIGKGVAMMGASMCPWVGEGMDAATAADPEAPWWDRGLALGSLGINGLSGGVLPNYSALRMARRAATPSGRALGQALEAAGFARPAGSAAHHIVAGGAEAAAPARAALERFGIGIHDAANGVFLPATRDAPNAAGAAVHSTLHTRAYYQAVNDALGQAATRQEAIEVLDSLRQSLLGGGL